jgi:SAM-dependent methyltransferase
VKVTSLEFWERVAHLPGLSPVIDYHAEETMRARYVHRLHVRALRRTVRAVAGERWLDYGCGVGRLTAWLAPQVAEVTAIDPSAAMIAEARRRVAAPNVRWLAVEEAPRGLPPLQVDGVLSIWVLQHILDEGAFGATLDYLAAALRPGGTLITLDRLCREPVTEVGDYLCIRHRGAYLDALAARGLRLVSLRPVSVGEQVLGSPALTRWVGRHESGQGPLSALDLAWAARRRDPFLADFLCEVRKSPS